ncbi:polyprenyl synthetase family protein [Streptacidiphilus melanogenes]|uniref:polyprenyl synthetase family protein n=1 Tax=Streptacidiphilus melanogenes TaxID=411235 RepID=UPI0005AB64C1|nr:polyprenyl synthetase family protein [Streptacidiphilus melanogenes]
MSLAQSAPAPVVGNPVDAEWLRQRVDAALGTFLTGQERTLLAISPQLAPLCGTVRDFLLDERPTGGKRLRAAFCYWGWRGAGGAADEPGAVAAAAALELLQASALVHDDLMDRSDTRRGLPSVHRRFETLHRGAGWRGDAEQFGGASAVLVGDLLLVWCDSLFAESGLPRDAVRRAKPLLDLMRTEVMAGQYLDMLEPAANWPGGDAGAVDRARTVIEYKSAKYTVQRPLQLGGLLADASADLTEAYGAFGLPLGEAFQLRDDLLGVYGDPAVTGKPAGDDLREGKRTLLVAETLASCGAADARLLSDLLGSPELDADGVERLRDVITRSGAPRRIEERIAALREEALAVLDAAPIREPMARGILTRLAAAATTRRH